MSRALWITGSIKLDNLPLGRTYQVHMEGCNNNRGRHTVVWSGDTTATLAGESTSWAVAADAPIRIVDAAPAVAPNLSAILPSGYTISNGTLLLALLGKSDTLLLATTGVDTILVDNKTFYPVVGGGNASLIVKPGESKAVQVVGSNGLTSNFQVTGYAKLPSASSLVTSRPSGSAWNRDTLSFALQDGKPETIEIDTAGVVGVKKGTDPVSILGRVYRISVTKSDTFAVSVTGDSGQSVQFTVQVRDGVKAVVQAGLVAHMRNLPDWVGVTCSLRVVIDTGTIDSVVLVAPARMPFPKSSDPLWKLDWPTTGAGDSLQVHVYGKGSSGSDSVLLGQRLKFDRQGPSIAIAGFGVSGILVGRSGGIVSWKASDDRGVASVWATEAGNASVSCPVYDSCQAKGVFKSFTVHAKDNLGNQTDSVVKVQVDSIAPRIESVIDVNTDGGLKDGDILMVASVTDKRAVSVVASDSLSGFQILARKVGANDSIAKVGSSSPVTLSGLTVGTWTISARDNLGNEATWGRIVVAAKVVETDSKPGLKVKPLVLPVWVGASCVVKVVRDSGTIQSIVGQGLDFKPNADGSEWTATWSPREGAKQDTLNLMVHGLGSLGEDSLHLQGIVSLDRDGPTIVLKSALTFGALRVGRNGGELAVSVKDARGVDSVWLTGTASNLAMNNGDSLYRAMVQGSVTVHARDSLGNVNTDPVAVVLDTVAPNGIGLKDGLGLDLSSGNSVHRDTVTGLAGLVVSASDSSGFFVSLKDSTDHLVGTQPGRNGSTRFDSLPVGTLRVVIEDSLGNRVQGTSEGVWGAFVVRPLLSKPVFNLPGGTYGGESTVYTDVMRRDLLQLKISCSDKADLIWRDSSSSTWSKTSAPFPTFQVGGGVIVSRCVNGVDSSLTDRRTYVVLQRPWIKMSDSLYAVDSLIVPIAIDSAGRFSKNPPTAKIQYCIGADTSEANWQNYSKDIVIKGTQTLRARVYDGEKYSHSSKRSFVQRAVTNWSRTFSSSQTATDTVALRNLYQAIAWSHYPFDTLSVSTANTGLDLTVNWKITGRVPKSYGYFGVDLFLDSDYSLYDFSAVDSITYDYIATGKYSDLLLYPVAADDDGSGYALNCQEAPNKAGAGHAVCRPGTIDLAYPAWDPTEPVVKKFWSDIRGSIKSLRIQAAPQSNSTGVPVDAKSTLTISKVNIYGKILKKP